MNRRERLMATLHGEPVDRPPVCFYEINGLDEKPDQHDPFNIYSDPSWWPLIELARERSDRIVMRHVPFRCTPLDPARDLTITETHLKSGSLFTTNTLKIGGRTLTSRTRRDPDVNTIWETEHLLKGVDDLKAYLRLPMPEFGGTPIVETILNPEAELDDTGIVMIDTPDPLCLAAGLFAMADYTVIALTEPALFHQLLERFAAVLLLQVEAIAQALPGRLWRIFGPEYASPPYLPPRLFEEYVVRYDTPMVESIQRGRGDGGEGGFARIHSHGNLRDILEATVSTGCVGLDPIEPPPQGDVELGYVRERYGDQLVLFGNIEASDIEILPTDAFRRKVDQALQEGTAGSGRGFVLMPSACPYGRFLSPLAVENYRAMVEAVENI